MFIYTASFEGQTVTQRSRRAVSHVAIHTNPDFPGKLVTSWHGSEKAAQRGDSDMKKYGWNVVAVLPVEIA